MTSLYNTKQKFYLNLPCGIVREYSPDIKRNETYMRLHQKKCCECRGLKLIEIMTDGRDKCVAGVKAEMLRKGTATSKIEQFCLPLDSTNYLKD
jgi:hypothetical protein